MCFNLQKHLIKVYQSHQDLAICPKTCLESTVRTGCITYLEEEESSYSKSNSKRVTPHPYLIFSLNLKVKDELLFNSLNYEKIKTNVLRSYEDTKLLGKVVDLKLTNNNNVLSLTLIASGRGSFWTNGEWGSK